jgi:hypothetical protein
MPRSLRVALLGPFCRTGWQGDSATLRAGIDPKLAPAGERPATDSGSAGGSALTELRDVRWMDRASPRWPGHGPGDAMRWNRRPGPHAVSKPTLRVLNRAWRNGVDSLALVACSASLRFRPQRVWLRTLGLLPTRLTSAPVDVSAARVSPPRQRSIRLWFVRDRSPPPACVIACKERSHREPPDECFSRKEASPRTTAHAWYRP